jgi:hypothetical protein
MDHLNPNHAGVTLHSYMSEVSLNTSSEPSRSASQNAAIAGRPCSGGSNGAA